MRKGELLFCLYRKPSKRIQETEQLEASGGKEAVDRYIESLPEREKELLVQELAILNRDLILTGLELDKAAFSRN